MKEIERWKRRLSAVAGVPLDWNEHPEAEYFSDKPGWDCFGALLLLVWSSKAQSRIPSVNQEETTANPEAPKALGTRPLPDIYGSFRGQRPFPGKKNVRKKVGAFATAASDVSRVPKSIDRSAEGASC